LEKIMQDKLSPIDRRSLRLLQHNADLSAAEVAEKVYLLKVVAKDIADYERFLRDHLLQRPHVHEAHSHIAMSEVKRTTELPLD
jgi:DNA-binding Lrp family transcriptional regulator